MTVTIVRYRIAPHRVDENVNLVREIFSQLHETRPDGLRYACLTTGDGSFMHIHCSDANSTDGDLQSLQSFQAFRSDFQNRALEPATFSEFEVVGNYRVF